MVRELGLQLDGFVQCCRIVLVFLLSVVLCSVLVDSAQATSYNADTGNQGILEGLALVPRHGARAAEAVRRSSVLAWSGLGVQRGAVQPVVEADGGSFADALTGCHGRQPRTDSCSR